MNRFRKTPQRLARRIASPLRGRKPSVLLAELPGFAVPAASIEVLPGPAAYRQKLLHMIATAQRRIVIVALYLQDDDGGREIMDALYAAHEMRLELDICVYVDWHRAQRGLIGHDKSGGNADMYREYAQRHGRGVRVCGVPVQTRELFGVLHLKGVVVDDSVLYSGASFNNDYLACHERYRLDRYHCLAHRGLADELADFMQRDVADSDAVRRLNVPNVPSTKELYPAIRDFREKLRQAHYQVPSEQRAAGEVLVTPLLGFGRTDNALNEMLLALLRQARDRVVLLTPYFNMPRPMRVAIGLLLRRGCRIDIIVGDKTASDFYLPPGQPITTANLLPYLYESNLRRFARAHRPQMASGQLNLWLWRHGDNSYHVKGVLVDDDISVLTGNNLNPRAWALDLENGLLLRDPDRLLAERNEAEWQSLQQHATRLADYRSLESLRDYPAEVRKRLKRLKRTRLDRLANRLL